jgi:phosphonate degradation associated HDIG domain protein
MTNGAEGVAYAIGLLLERGARLYGDEPVTQKAHALQCATLAREAGADDELVVAALLHDVGHLLDVRSEQAGRNGVDLHHETVGASWVQRWFPRRVADTVRLHVPAKRWLCATDARYHDGLSDASRRSLKLQGGPMTSDEAERFARHPQAEWAVALRRWDDLAKDPTMALPSVVSFESLLRAVASTRATETHANP